MAVLCESLGLLYLQVPATGCSVLGKALRAQDGAVDLGAKHDDLPTLKEKKLLRDAELEKLLVVANVRNPFDRFVSYYQRLEGGWVDQGYLAVLERRLARDESAGELDAAALSQRRKELLRLESRMRSRRRWLRWSGFNSWFLVTLLRWRRSCRDETEFCQRFCFPMLAGVDLVLAQERLQQAADLLLEGLAPGKRVTLPVRNVTPGKRPYSNYYNGVGRRLAAAACAGSMARFGYSFSGLEDGRSMTAITPKGQAFLSQTAVAPAAQRP